MKETKLTQLQIKTTYKNMYKRHNKVDENLYIDKKDVKIVGKLSTIEPFRGEDN